MIRVLHVIPSVSPLRGGPSHAALGIVRKLNSLGVTCEIVTTDDDGPGHLDVPLESPTEFEGCPVRFFRRWRPPIPALREYAFSWPLTVWLKQNITNYDVIHVHALFSYPSTVAMLIARRAGIPYLVRPLGLLCEWALRQKSFKKRAYLNLIERKNLDGARVLEFSTPAEQQEASVLRLKPPSVVFPLGFELQANVPDARQRLHDQLGIPKDTPVIVFLSRLHPKKGIDVLLRALGRVKRFDFSFVIAGSGERTYEVSIDGLIAANGLKDRTHLMGFQHGDEKAVTLQGSDIFALTSHSESFGIAVAEAMAAGLPVIITPGIPLAPVVAQHDFGWVPRLDEQEIAQALAAALVDLVQAKDKGRRAAEYARAHYTWDAFASDLAELYQAVKANKKINETYE